MENELRDKLVYITGRSNMRLLSRLNEEFYRRFPKAWVSFSAGKDATYIFEDSRAKKGFEEILKEHNILYSNVVPERKIEKFADLSYSGGVFENNSSMEGFIRGYKSIDDVVKLDSIELEKGGGSFDAIADRMEEIVRFGKNIEWPEDEDWAYNVDAALEKVKREHGEDWDDCPEALAKFYLMRDRILAGYPNFKLDDKVCVTGYSTTRGFQVCPFEGCQKTWNDDAFIGWGILHPNILYSY